MRFIRGLSDGLSQPVPNMFNPIVNAGRIDPRFLNRTTFEHTFRIETRFRLSAADVLNGLSDLLLAEDIGEIGRSDGTGWNVTVNSREAAETLRDVGTIMCGDRQCRIVSVSLHEIEVRVHWLPAYVRDELLFEIFKKFGRVREVKREKTIINEKVSKQNGVRTVILQTDDLAKAGIPHLYRFEGGISMLLTLRGRPPLCLRCNRVGHMRRDCPGALQTHQPQPPMSYAAVVAPDERGDEPEPKETATQESATQESATEEPSTQDPASQEPVTQEEKPSPQVKRDNPDDDSDDSDIPCGQGVLVIDENYSPMDDDTTTFERVMRSKKVRVNKGGGV